MSRQTEYPKYFLLGVEVDALTIEQAISYIIDRATNPAQPACYVVKPYVEFMDRAANNAALRQILNQAELALPDGIALLWAAAYWYNGRRSWARFWRSLSAIILAPQTLRQPLPERFGGISFTWPLLQAAAQRRASVFLIGKESPAAAEALAEHLRRQLPGLDIIGALSGHDPGRPAGQVSEHWIQNTLQALQQAQPDIVLVGMGFPLQEHVISRFAPQLSHGVLIGEGGTFDYEQFGGHRRKAPPTMQRLGLEWLWRLLLEPRRFRRQLAIPRFIWRVWRSQTIHRHPGHDVT
ncbi:MAG TPA: WecB/TagA/CpsF family glycosyltransferase [Candidatus Saccharimonadia bacterium]|nr:WecB/TagA/CpsF family glycosyltransferase [Candidatus Saccharimonadia bacterium]